MARLIIFELLQNKHNEPPPWWRSFWSNLGEDRGVPRVTFCPILWFSNPPPFPLRRTKLTRPHEPSGILSRGAIYLVRREPPRGIFQWRSNWDLFPPFLSLILFAAQHLHFLGCTFNCAIILKKATFCSAVHNFQGRKFNCWGGSKVMPRGEEVIRCVIRITYRKQPDFGPKLQTFKLGDDLKSHIHQRKPLTGHGNGSTLGLSGR